MLNENRTDAASIASDSGHDSKVVSTKKSSAESTTKPAKKTRTEATRDAVTMRKHFVLDTNVLLHNAGSIFKFAEHEVVIPLAVIEELDGFKKGNDETGRNARQVTRALDRLRSQGALFQGVVWNEQGGSIRVARCDARTPFALDLDKADNRILAVASELHAAGHRTIFISKDINARVKSDALGIAAEDFEADHIVSDFLHAGYIVMKVPGEIIDELYDERQLRIERLMEFEATAPDGQRVEVEAVANQFIMLVDAMDEHHTGLARMLADTGAAIPVTGPRKPVYGIMGRNVQQTMALELLLDDDVKIVTLTGPAGTGKTLLALACGLHKTLKEERFDKLLTARPIMPLGRDIGYLPGDKDEKLSMWMQPIFDNISYLLSTRGSHSDERPESRTAEQRLDQLMATGRVVLEPLTYIRGRSIPHQFMIVDEAQNLSPHEIKTIVSRVGDGTKIVLCGDVLQIDNPYLDAASNGLAHCIERMKGQRIAGHVSLSKTERSHLASLAAEIL